jgi:hypothetical protein
MLCVSGHRSHSSEHGRGPHHATPRRSRAVLESGESPRDVQILPYPKDDARVVKCQNTQGEDHSLLVCKPHTGFRLEARAPAGSKVSRRL